MFDHFIGCRRNFYRLRYPLSNRPTLCIADCDHTYEVTELSERGFRMRCTSDRVAFQIGESVSATINFPGRHLPVAGVVARHDRDEVVVVEVEGVSFGLIMEEQRRLAALFLAAIDNSQK